jgi:type I restriction enzyme S subunit
MKLADVVTLKRGKTYKSALLGDEGIPLLGLATIEREGGFRRDNFKRYSGDPDHSLIVRSGEIYASLKDVTQNAYLLGSVARLPAEIGEGRLTQDNFFIGFCLECVF